MTSEPTAEAALSERQAPTCDKALAHAFGLLGKRWNGVILGTLMEGSASFSEVRRALNGISDSVLSDRLSELAAAGLVTRTVDAGPPVSVAYALTEAGRGLMPALTEITSWARINYRPEAAV
ncbi:winged helix-turn-helix transcriptional regulator [Parafrigoribacterium soli]|uniref:winged helix-turn-helix transcriptional regulator n=1 Tax=Parafrigoribacterium soli TaxID=3144663 RepID=UPI0032EB8BC7